MPSCYHSPGKHQKMRNDCVSLWTSPSWLCSVMAFGMPKCTGINCIQCWQRLWQDLWHTTLYAQRVQHFWNSLVALNKHPLHFLRRSRSSLNICGLMEWGPDLEGQGHVKQGISGFGPDWERQFKTWVGGEGWGEGDSPTAQRCSSRAFVFRAFGRYWPDVSLGGSATQTFSLWRKITLFIIILSLSFC